MNNISVNDLKYKSEFGINSGKYQEGYRIVYFYPDGTYKVGIFSGTIEDFMMNFAAKEPIEGKDNIPPFTSVNNILDRFLNRLDNTSAVAIYKTDGTCIAQKERNKFKHDLKP